MRLKRLELLGFKSFVHKTVIPFEADITCIVGPNGCGKSNIVDAIKWVLGETSSKQLRGESMGDVIFHGSDSLPPLGMAEVTLVFDNEDGSGPSYLAGHSEIQICRRVFRSGDSEYYINKTPCRLKDIVDIFLGTGLGGSAYSIVEQGKISEIISSKPLDHRAMVEEAAGITRYKERKREALRKMEHTGHNLDRVCDVIGEIKRQINSLERQARKAKRYRQMKDRLRSLELFVAAEDKNILEAKISDITKEIELLEGERINVEASARRHDSLAEQGELKLKETEELASKQREVCAELERGVYSLHEKLKYASARAEELSADLSRLEEEQRSDSSRLEALKNRREELASELASLERSLAASDEEVKSLDHARAESLERMRNLENKRESLKKRLIELHEALTRNRSTVEHSEREIHRLTASVDKLRAEKVSLEEERAAKERALADARSQMASLEEERRQISFDFDSAERSVSELESEIKEKEKEYLDLSAALAAQKSELDSLRDLQGGYQGFDEGIREIMLSENRPQALVGVLADFLQVPAEYEKAVAAVLESVLQGIVFSDHTPVLSELKRLKSLEKGRGRFLPMQPKDDVDLDISGEEIPSDIKPLLSLIEVDSNIKKLALFLLRDVYVVPSLDRAWELYEQNGHTWILVTPDGDVVHPSGMIVGGGRDTLEAGFLARNRRIEEICDTLASLEERLAALQTERSELETKLASHKERAESIRQKNLSKELDIMECSKKISILEGEIERTVSGINAVSLELEENLNSLSAAKDIVSKARSEAESLESSLNALKVEVEEIENKISAEREETEKRRQAWMEKHAVLAAQREKVQALSREMESCDRGAEELSLRLEKLAAEIDAKRRELSENEHVKSVSSAEAEEMEKSLAAAKEKLSGFLSEIERLRLEVEQARAASVSDRQRASELSQRISDIKLRLSETQMELRTLKDRIWEKYGVEPGQWTPSDEEAESLRTADTKEIRREIEELQGKIARYGEVNMASIEELSELEERLSFMESQKADLEQSMENLKRTIRKINATTKEKFLEAFNEINRRFERIFPILFRGGRAKLVLQDPEDLLQTGVEIFAQPPGTKLQNMKLLSGGQKALTAISLLFAIFLYKPTPFCLLDEVDAPLDDVNVGRFNDLVKELSKNSQFIIITHNKSTMSMADVLYGVTMQEAGVSRLVGVKVAGSGEESPVQSERAVA